MNKEIAQLQKLVERKKAYLLRLENPRAIDAIKAEINILQNTINAMIIETENKQALERFREDKDLKQYEDIKTLKIICLLHGINDYPVFIMQGLQHLEHELKWDRSENCVRIPNQLRKNFYGE